jgi:transposase-like protein
MEALTLQRQPRVSAEERARWLAQYRSSQLSARQFAEQHGLNAGTLSRWIREEGQCNPPSRETPGFQQVHLSSLVSPGGWGAEVVLPSGIAVRLATTASAAWMRSLWESLRSSC